jgi:hypothetical protein
MTRRKPPDTPVPDAPPAVPVEIVEDARQEIESL